MMEVNRKDISKLQKILKLNLPYRNRALSGLKLEKTMEILIIRSKGDMNLKKWITIGRFVKIGFMLLKKWLKKHKLFDRVVYKYLWPHP